MAELVDALASGASGGNPVEVQVLFSAPNSSNNTENQNSQRHCIYSAFFVSEFSFCYLRLSLIVAMMERGRNTDWRFLCNRKTPTAHTKSRSRFLTIERYAFNGLCKDDPVLEKRLQPLRTGVPLMRDSPLLFPCGLEDRRWHDDIPVWHQPACRSATAFQITRLFGHVFSQQRQE